MPGSTILQRKLGDHSTTRALSPPGRKASRSVQSQPYVLAGSRGQPGRSRDQTEPGKGSSFPLTSYIWNPPGTRPKPVVTSPNKDLTIPIKGESWKQSVFRRAWADMSDTSDEEPGALEQLQPAVQATGLNQSPSVLINMSRHKYRKLKQFAFWKIRKVPQARRSKSVQACEEESSASEDVEYQPSGLAPLRLQDPGETPSAATVNVRSRDSPNHEKNRCHPGNYSGKCTRAILDAVWTKVAASDSSHQVCLASLSPPRRAVSCAVKPGGCPFLSVSGGCKSRWLLPYSLFQS